MQLRRENSKQCSSQTFFVCIQEIRCIKRMCEMLISPLQNCTQVKMSKIRGVFAAKIWIMLFGQDEAE